MPRSHPIFLPVPDRRSQSAFNRLRRFFNDYWLVPVVVVYLQLLAALMGAPDHSGDALATRNRMFISGVPLVYRMVTTDFPYAIIGHGKEVLHAVEAESDILSSEALSGRITPHAREIYLAIWHSRDELETEYGGVVRQTSAGDVALYPIPSSNGAFVRAIKKLPRDDAMARLTDIESRAMVDTLTGNALPLDRVAQVIADPLIDPTLREAAFNGILYTLEITSRSRYLVRPVAFKASLGHMPGWRYTGVFHFHNQLDSPPSPTDVAASAQTRQLVFCLARDGFDLYDIRYGRITQTHYQVLPEAWITQPEWHPLHRDPDRTSVPL